MVWMMMLSETQTIEVLLKVLVLIAEHGLSQLMLGVCRQLNMVLLGKLDQRRNP